MKKATILFLLLVFVATTFCQQTAQKLLLTKTDYLQKSKEQKTAAWILLGGGTALIGIGFLVGDSKESTFDDAATGALLAGVGLLSAIGSIPFFISSGKNKNRANKAYVFINMEKVPVIQGTTFINQSCPVIGLKIKI